MSGDEYYISIDIEANGPLPGVNSMLQLGAVFYNSTGTEITSYSVNLEEIENGIADPETMKWWDQQELKTPGLCDKIRKDAIEPKKAMETFKNQVHNVSSQLKCSPVVIAYPSGYDFTFLYWYLYKFLGSSCVGFSCVDIKTLAMATLQSNYKSSTKKSFPKHWFDKSLKHTHNALDDAREQGYTFFKIKEELNKINSSNIIKDYVDNKTDYKTFKSKIDFINNDILDTNDGLFQETDLKRRLKSYFHL